MEKLGQAQFIEYGMPTVRDSAWIGVSLNRRQLFGGKTKETNETQRRDSPERTTGESRQATNSENSAIHPNLRNCRRLKDLRKGWCWKCDREIITN